MQWSSQPSPTCHQQIVWCVLLNVVHRFIAGLWGMLFFGELRGVMPRLLYWVSGAVLVSGVALLALSGQE